MIRTTTLPNGLLVLTESMSHVRSATIGVWADVGSAAEPADRRGISHLLEHMVFKGHRGAPRVRSPKRWTRSAASSTR